MEPVYETDQAEPEQVSPKDPGETLDYGFDLRAEDPWLEPGESNISATAVVESGSMQIVSQSFDADGCTFWLEQGTEGENTIIKASGMTDSVPIARTWVRRMLIPCAAR